jgi:DNA-binding beta-propeller fold protein YncE
MPVIIAFYHLPAVSYHNDSNQGGFHLTYGKGKYTYELADWHVQYPDGWSPIEVNGLAVDSQDRLYAFNTGEYPLTVFDTKTGKLLSHWGEGFFTHNHGARIFNDAIYYADDGNHTVHKMTLDGKVLMTLGTKDKPSDTGYTTVDKDGNPIHIMEAIKSTKRGGPPFNVPTGVALDSKGNIYVTDGYGNARVHKFTPDGKLVKSWGEPGSGPSEFAVPHAIAIDKNDKLYVADRHNNRIQIFDTEGKYLGEWKDNIELPTDIIIDKDQTVYVTDLLPRISIFDINGNLQAQWGNEGTTKEDPLMVTLHAITLDSKGNIYVAEVMGIHAGTPFLETRKGRMIHKFIKK